MKAVDDPHPNPAIVRHEPNPVGGRDLVIGDLHGEFDTLEHALETLGFQPARDRLFTVGDLIDRGPRSADALEWLETGRFAGSVRGNHEQVMIRALTCGEAVLMRMNGSGAMWLANGADWWYESAAVSEARSQRRRVPKGGVIDRWLEAIARMPYLTLIEYGSRRVGLVHSPGAADCEEHWEQIWKQAESVPAPGARGHEPARQQLEYALLWRDPRRRAATHDDPKLDEALEGVDLVITGHCPSLWPTWTRRNVITIDTGVHYEAFGHLTVAEIQDGLTLHRVARTETFPQTEKSHR